ncbi:MAG: hypothetical protein ABIP35_14020 [Ginsengibacter sp.]
MNIQLIIITTRKPIFLLALFAFLFVSCENHRFDSDKRQIEAKDEVRRKLPKIHSFDITGFSEDTIIVQDNADSKKQIRYTLDISFVDSNNVSQNKKGVVMFPLFGLSIITSKIIDP